MPLASRTPTRDEPWADRMEKLRQTWRLKPGQAFRQADWSAAKNATLGELRGDGYPTASWQSTRARIDAKLLDRADSADGADRAGAGNADREPTSRPSQQRAISTAASSEAASGT